MILFKYQFTETSTNEEFQKILKRYPKINCIICNSQTAKCFKRGLVDKVIKEICPITMPYMPKSQIEVITFESRKMSPNKGSFF